MVVSAASRIRALKMPLFFSNRLHGLDPKGSSQRAGAGCEACGEQQQKAQREDWESGQDRGTYALEENNDQAPRNGPQSDPDQ